MAEQAVALHQRGDLGQAEALYLRILETDPRLYGPRFYMGLLKLQQGRAEEACDYLGEAVQISPDQLPALMNYGMALRAAGRPEEALAAFDRALALQPQMAEGFYNRGVALGDLNRYELAVESYERALVLAPELMAAHVNRAVALAAMRRFDDAIAGYDRALAMQPNNVPALFHRGLAHRTMKRPEKALADLDRALAVDPSHADARYHRGVVMMDLERAADSLASFDAVMGTHHANAEMLNNRGVALWNLKRPAEALESYERALALEPDFAEAWGNRGLALRDLARPDDAVASFDMALRLEPNNTIALNSRGNALRDKKAYEAAIESYSRAIQIRPDYAEAIINRGYTWWALKDFDAGTADVERGLALNPDYPYGRGELFHIRMYSADWHDFDQRKAELENLVRAGKQVVQPFIFQAIAETPADAQACSRIWGEKKYPPVATAPHDPASRKDRKKIRIGYLSGEFRHQATAILMAGLYERHDRDRFEIIAVSAGDNDQSPMRARLEKAFDRWLDISKLSDQDAADVIRDAGIDILVCLNGYFGEARMGVFARRPAPIQVNYLGFPATLGAAYIDYLIADRIVIPEGEQRFYDEQVVYLPNSYQVNDDRGREMAPTPSRSQAGLPEDAFVFCNFNNAYKLTPSTFAGWMRILKQAEGSVLWLLESTAPYPDNLRREAEKHGVPAQRLIFAPDLPTAEHLARLQLADLFLDSLPYNAHTTGSDALWAGVPLLTCRGNTFPGRVAASILTAAGLPELITESQADFEALAVRLACDRYQFQNIRNRLIQNRKINPLFDTGQSCGHIESAYLTMWQSWLAGEKPQGFSVA